MQIVRRIVEGPNGGIALAEVRIDHPLFNRDKPANEAEQLLFRVDTYKPLAAKQGPEPWAAHFGPINGFLATLTQDEHYIVHDFYLAARRALNRIHPDPSDTAYERVQREIADLFAVMAQHLRLAPRLVQYVHDSGIPIPMLIGIGTRPHDTADLTFTRPEYFILTGISLLCKLVSPVWGDYIYRTKVHLDDVAKEMYCLSIIEAVLEQDTFHAVYTKLDRFLSRMVRTEISRRESNSGSENQNSVKFVAANGGFSEVRLLKTIYSIVFVKKFTNINLMTPECDIMRYISVNITETFKTRIGQLSNKKGRPLPRNDPSDNDREDNVTILDHDSRVSSSTADIPMMTRLGARHAVQHIQKRYGIPEQVFEQTVGYYHRHPFEITLFNRALVASMVGEHIGGSYGIRYFDMPTWIDMVSLTQLALAMQGHAELAHLLSASVDAEPRQDPASPVDQAIASSLRSTYAFRQLASLYPFAIERRGIESQIDLLRDWMLLYHHHHNTAPAVSNALDEETPPAKGERVRYGESVMAQVCDFFYRQHAPQEP